ncbi:spermatogenesis-associated protein 13 [Pygocentrus nattereri]|uniref:Spermatogenesis associated 13 n=1 Tax=Pygocentrus nattereri TaxID=42514 RepID=A0A3B4EJX1_PYGNA|nr:spermatogenesis-associated protein 13 [Pygocentrus nattereri]
MRKAALSDGASSLGEASLCYPSCGCHDIDPEAPGRPICSSFNGEKLMNPVTSCGAQVKPVLSEGSCEKHGLNGLKPQTWSSSVITDGQTKSCPTRIVRIFSSQRKCGMIGPEQTSLRGPSNGPQAWPGLSGLRVMGSFKKLRSSVLQGIQNRGSAMGASQDKDFSSITSEHGSGFLVTKRDPGQVVGGSQSISKEIPTVTNGESIAGRKVSDEEDDYEEDGGGPKRNSHFSMSIRRAYGAGRISLLDNGARKPDSLTVQEPASQCRPCSSVELIGPDVILDSEENVKALSRLSKSADNLHIFKSPFKRKAPSAQPQCPKAFGTLNIQRAASASSVDMQERGAGQRKNPMGVRGQMLKLVGSLTDISANHKASPCPSPKATLSALSQLHDSYSRRTPCVLPSERQRRPAPVNIRASDRQKIQADIHRFIDTPALNPTPSVPILFSSSHNEAVEHSSPKAQFSGSHKQLQSTSPGSPLHILLSPVTGNCGTEEEQQYVKTEHCMSPSQEQTQNSIKVNLECIWKTPERDAENLEAASSEDATADLLKLNNERCNDSVFANPPVTPTCASESPMATTPTSPASGSDTPTSSVPRRRAGRSRPRPISDYGQLVCRKYSIPEEEMELQAEEMDYTSQEDCNSNERCPERGNQENGYVNVHFDNKKTRPISVIGGVDLFASPDDKEDTDSLPSRVPRPPLPSHGVPPYRAVSARLRPCVFSQSTPTGLDRVGRHQLHRILSEGSSYGCPGQDDSVSEEDGSFDELTEGTPYLQPEVDLSTLNQYIKSGHAVYAEALWDHVTMGEQELAFKAGDVIRVLDAQEQDWWWGMVGEREAWFPSSFVRVRVNQEDSGSESVESSLDQEEPLSKEPRSQSSEHRKQMRANVVQEIMNTERVYIKHLRDICEGYIRQCRKHPDMFTEAQLKTIFSNIEEIYKFQRKFLKDLEKKYNKENPHLSEIGSCFLQQGDGFSIYSEYCNTHPAACVELQRLMKQGRYKHFFEACRLLQQMIDISIAGFLLTPVQKICKYPLQLGELLKYTPKDHSDYEGVCNAHEAMKNVASLINERKRRLESIDTIAHWQVAILDWEGEDVLSRSSELIHSGELTRVVRAGKTQQRSFFLFDHQLVFCKKDVLRRDLLHYRGCLDTDHVELVELPDGRHPDLGSLRNAFALRHAENLEVLCVLCCRKAQDKQRWLQAFARERRRVKEDQEIGMEISETQRKQAIQNARKSKQGKLKNINYSGHPVPLHHQPLHPLHQRHVTVPTSIPQQQVFSLAEPKRKPSHLWYTFTRTALFRK